MIYRPFILIVLLIPSIAHAEDAAHRADRLRTQALNEQAKATVVRRDHGNVDQREAYGAAMERYQRERAEWRDRVAACRAGRYEACDVN